MGLIKKRKNFQRNYTSSLQIVRDNYGKHWRDTSKNIKALDKKRCAICGKLEGLETHHIVPLSHGGRTVKANLIVLCKTCHRRKHKH